MHTYLTYRMMNAASKLYLHTTEVHVGDYTSQDKVYGWCSTCEKNTWSEKDSKGVYRCEDCNT